MADQYWIDIHHSRPHKDYVNDIDITTGSHLGDRQFSAMGDRQFAAVGKKYRLSAEVEAVGGHHHGHSRSQRYWGMPLFYIPEYGDVSINSTATDPDEIPDAVEGNLDVGAAWYRKARDGMKEFRAKWHRDPNADQGRAIALYIANIKKNMAASDEFSFEHNQGRLDFLIANGRRPSAAEDANIGRAAEARVNGHKNAYAQTHKSLGDDLVYAFNTVSSIAGAPINAVTSLAEKIPLVGPIIHEGLGLDPVKALGGMTAQVLHGERLDRAFLDTAKDQLHHVKELAPYVQTVMSFVPGVGTGVAAAIAAGTALAEGRTISDAVLEGIKGAVPGGQLGKTALAAALAITHGDSVSSTVLNAVKSNLPPGIQQAVDAAVATAGGKNVRTAVLQAIGNQLPPAAKKALDVGIALGAARNIQSSAVRAVAQPAAITRLAAKKVPPQLHAFIPRGSDAAKGFQAMSGLLQHRGVTPHVISSLHAALNPAQKRGAEAAVKAYKNHFHPHHTSLVRGGLVTRGPWKKVAANTKGAIPGRLVSGKTITHGHFVRV